MREMVLQEQKSLFVQTDILSDYSLYILIGIVAFVLFAFIIAILLTRIGSRKKYVSAILNGTEELLRGNLDWKVEVKKNGDLARIAANINQLSTDFRERMKQSQDARDYFHNLVESPHEYAIISTTTDWDVYSFNSRAVTLFGWQKEEIAGKSISTTLSEATWLNLLPSLARRELREKLCIRRGELRRKDGSLFPGIITIDTIRMKSGEVIGYLIIVRDLSDEVMAEKDLTESEDKYRSLVEGLLEGVFIVQLGKIVYANASFARMVGMEVDRIAGIPFKDLLSTENILFALEQLRGVEENRSVNVRMDLLLIDQAGKIPIEAEMTVSAILFQGKPAIIASVMDVSMTRRIEREIKLSKNRLDATLDSVSDAIMMVSRVHRGPVIVLVNRSFQNLFGLEPEGILGLPFERAMQEISRLMKNGEHFYRVLNVAIERDTTDTFFFEKGDDEGSIIECFTTAVREEEGAVTGRIFSFRDVTDQKRLERGLTETADEIKKSKDALERAYRELNIVNEDLRKRAVELDRLNQELKSLDEMKTKLLANVSHELQTPLVSIKGYTDMILKGKLGSITEEQEKGLKISLKNIERLIAMIDNLLEFARMGKALEKMVPTIFPLWQVIDETVELVRERMEASDISITTKYQTGDLMVNADREKISQVFINLLSNAIKFNKRGGEVRVSVRKGTPGFLAIDVKDTGVGIPEEHIRKIFDRFYRAEPPGSTLMEGTGIGLSIVKDILAMHNCTICVQSSVGEGSTFTFTLPMAETVREERTPEASAPADDLHRDEAHVAPSGEQGKNTQGLEDPGRGKTGSPPIRIKIIKNPLKDNPLRR